ncbi:MAG: DUF5104 domain-containing protein [Huintestinicola sp.]|uniref:DUF5104 domain-containing protein n=1 Tax=Huintestinicola sp. TaxID=2981661 RepID=UPI003F04C658
MAFASLMFVFVVIICLVLGSVLVTGIILLISGITKVREPKYIGRALPAVLIAAGSVLIAIPVGIVIFLTVSGLISSAEMRERRSGYENVTELWRNERVSENSAAVDAMNELLSAADNGDRESFGKLFTVGFQNSESFESAINEFFEAYPAGLSECERESSGVSKNSSGEVRKGSVTYTCMMNGEWYRIKLKFCCYNENSPDEVGVEFFCIEDLEGAAADTYYGYKHLVCNIKSDSEVSARLISGMPFLFEPDPERQISAAEMIKLLRKYDSLYGLSEEIGKPNVTKKYSNSTGYDHYYELVPKEDIPLYAHICTSSEQGEILYADICSDTKSFYNVELNDEE